ncbi:hypothetical protein ACA910_005094 [Epithemia clementina (nom. ined.)]
MIWKIKESSGRSLTLRELLLRFLAFGGVAMVVQQCVDQITRPPMANAGDKLTENRKNYHHLDSVRIHGISKDTPVFALTNLTDLRNTTAGRGQTGAPVYWEDAIRKRREVIDILEQAGIKIDLELLRRLPKWKDVSKLYGDQPVILGMERCQEFCREHRPANRTAAIAGMFNTGTNAMAQYFYRNLQMPDNPNLGFLANVPWHKHGWVDLRGRNFFRDPSNHESVLPIVIIRDPYGWFQSMCESPYLLHWDHGADHCPNLVDEGRTSVPTKLALGQRLQFRRAWDSLVHVWSEWYCEYYDADFPRLMIRFEDILFHTPQVMDAIRRCAGGEWKNSHFNYQTASSKGGKKYFEDIKPQTSMLSAIIKYGQDNGRRTRNMTKYDLIFARKHLDQRLMDAFHYIHPDEM